MINKRKKIENFLCIAGIIVGFLAFNMPLNAAEDAAPSEQEKNEALIKASQNPIANMISLPFQSNFNLGYGPEDDLQYILKIQPVIPFSLRMVGR